MINCLPSFSTIGNKTIRMHVKHDPTLLSNFMSRLPALTQVVESKISKLLPYCFALLFHGWSFGTMHYLVLFVLFQANNTERCSHRLFTFSPFDEESSFGSEEHIRFINYVLSMNGKTKLETWINVSSFVGDNCNVNKSVAAKQYLTLLGYSSDVFNLAVKDILAEYETMLRVVNALM